MAYGQHPSNEPHTLSANTNPVPGSEASRRVAEFMASKNGGGDPVTALAVRGETKESSAAVRDATVRHDMNAALARLDRSSGSNTSSNP